MSAKVKHIHVPYTVYSLCKKDGGIHSNKEFSNCKTCLKFHKKYKQMLRELSACNGVVGDVTHILVKHGFI